MTQELERHQLDLRYEALRTRSAPRERRLLASLAEVGQQVAVVVVRDGERHVVVDGYKRVRALRRLGHDTVLATLWDLPEVDALVLEQVLRRGEAGSAIEQGWLLRELMQRFGLGLDELARRFERTKSWVSRRVALVGQLPASVHGHVRAGAIGSHAAMKYLVPLARANIDDCTRLADAIAPTRPTSRQMGALYAAYTTGNARARELLLSDPALVLRAHAEGAVEEETPLEQLLDDLRVVGAVARRASGRLRRGALDGASAAERGRVHQVHGEAITEIDALRRRFEKEANDARSHDTLGDPAAA